MISKHKEFQATALLGFCLFFISSCVNEVDLNINLPEDKIAINCIHQNGSTIKVYAHHLSPLDEQPQKYTTLKMRLLDNGIELGTSKFGRDSVYYFTETFAQIASIEIIDTLTKKTYAGSLENLDIVTIDEAVRYPQITRPDPEIPESDHTFVLHQVTFTDQKDIDNYYHICLGRNHTEWEDELFMNSAIFTRSTSDYRHRILFSDKLFKNKSVTLDIFIRNSCETVELRNVSKSYFNYFKSLESHYESQNVSYYDETALDYFFQPLPVALYSNVTNGLGAFVSYSKSQATFKVDSSED